MWARIGIFLIAALLGAAAAGAWFGHILAQNAPQSPTAPRVDATMPVTEIGANGGARVPEPPQPRMDGTLGVPVRTPPRNPDEIPLVSVMDDPNPRIAMSTRQASAEPLDPIAQLGLSGEGRTSSGFSIATVEAQPDVRQDRPNRDRPELPPELAFAVAQPAEPATGGAPAWQQALRESLGRCGRQRFFSEEECEHRLRVQYCEPNGGWGRVAECPAALRNARF